MKKSLGRHFSKFLIWTFLCSCPHSKLMPSCENPCPDGSAHYCLPWFPLTAPSWKVVALLISGSSDKRMKTFSSHQLSGSNPGKGGEVKAGLLNPRSHITSHTVFSIRHLLFLCQLFSLWFLVSPFSSSIKSHTRAFGSPPSVHSTRHPQLHSRNQTDNVQRGFVSSALGFHLLTSVCTGFMGLLT